MISLLTLVVALLLIAWCWGGLVLLVYFGRDIFELSFIVRTFILFLLGPCVWLFMLVVWVMKKVIDIYEEKDSPPT